MLYYMLCYMLYVMSYMMFNVLPQRYASSYERRLSCDPGAFPFQLQAASGLDLRPGRPDLVGVVSFHHRSESKRIVVKSLLNHHKSPLNPNK